jgi:hypothetical protein
MIYVLIFFSEFILILSITLVNIMLMIYRSIVLCKKSTFVVGKEMESEIQYYHQIIINANSIQEDIRLNEIEYYNQTMINVNSIKEEIHLGEIVSE